MLTIIFLIWSIIRAAKKPPPTVQYNAPPMEPEVPLPLSPQNLGEPYPDNVSDDDLDTAGLQELKEHLKQSDLSINTRSSMSNESRSSVVSIPSSLDSRRYSELLASRTNSFDRSEAGNTSRASVTSISSSTSFRRYEIMGQRSIDSRASITSIYSSDFSRRDSEAIIPEHDDDMLVDDATASQASNGSNSEGANRRHSETLAVKRRSSSRSSQIRRQSRRYPLGYDRRRTTGRY